MVCQHPDRTMIDLALLLHVASYRGIARHFGLLGNEGLRRHERNHLPSTFRQSQELQAMLSAEYLVEDIDKWRRRTVRQYRKADAANDVTAANAVIRTANAADISLLRLLVLGKLVADTTATTPTPVTLPTPSPDSKRAILKMLIESGAAIGPEDFANTTEQENENHGTEESRPAAS
jgi:molybdenum cofactor biosynthesis enzyme MoaA